MTRSGRRRAASAIVPAAAIAPAAAVVLATAVVLAVLGEPTGAAARAAAPPVSATVHQPAVTSRGHGLTAAARATIRCPKPKVAPPRGIPRRPVPPPDDPVGSIVGGAALASHGLVVPPGVRRPPAVTATTWLVADLDTGAVLGACGPHVYQTPASVQKTLLAATVLDKLDPKKIVTVRRSDLDIEPNSSAVGLVVGGRYRIATLWLGLLLNSGNDAANALARLAGGGGPDGVARTVAAMNAEANRLGAAQTHAVTPSGLDGKGQFTSAYDLALIARKNFANADFRRYVLTRTARMPRQPQVKQPGFQFQNENKLIYKYPGAMGGKTGFTTVARHSYVGAAHRHGRRLVVTLLGAEASPVRGWQQGAALLDWGFSLPAEAAVGHLVTPDEVAARPATESAVAAAAPTRTQARSGPPRALALLAAGMSALVLALTPLLWLTQRRRRTAVPRL